MVTGDISSALLWRSSVKGSLNESQEVQFILDLHNEFRRRVVPGPPKDMPMLKWDDTLAGVAEAWARECTWGHAAVLEPDFVFQNGGSTEWTGENLCYHGRGYGDWQNCLSMFVAEKDDWDYCEAKCRDGKICGHYTQVVWAKTTSVGCAMVPCTTGGMKDRDFYACFYFPGGNIRGHNPYEVSEGTKKEHCSPKPTTPIPDENGTEDVVKPVTIKPFVPIDPDFAQLIDESSDIVTLKEPLFQADVDIETTHISLGGVTIPIPIDVDFSSASSLRCDSLVTIYTMIIVGLMDKIWSL